MEETKGLNIEILTLEYFSYFQKTVRTQTLGQVLRKALLFQGFYFQGQEKVPGGCVHCTVFYFFHIGNCSTKFNQLIFKPVFFGVAGYISIKQFNIEEWENREMVFCFKNCSGLF